MDNKKVKEKDEGQAVVNHPVTATPPPTEVKEEVKKVPTVKERIDQVVDKYEDKIELKKEVFKLVQRILHPEQFCPECDERTFFDPTTASYSCPNCGYETRVNTATTTARPVVRPTGAVPPQVEKIIQEASQNMRENPLPRAKGALGDKIRKLVDARDSGTSAPTAEDEARIKNSDKNVAHKINWV